MSRYVIYVVIGLVVTCAIAYIFYQYGQTAGVTAGVAGAAALAGKYRLRGQESERLKNVVTEAHKDAKAIRQDAEDITDHNVKIAKAKTGDELAADVDSMT